MTRHSGLFLCVLLAVYTPCGRTEADKCDMTHQVDTQPTRYFQTPGFDTPDGYKSHSQCDVVFQALYDGDLLEVTVNTSDINPNKKDNACVDRAYFYDGTNNGYPKLGTVCAEDTPTFTSSGRSISMSFVAGENKNHWRGMRLAFRSIDKGGYQLSKRTESTCKAPNTLTADPKKEVYTIPGYDTAHGYPRKAHCVVSFTSFKDGTRIQIDLNNVDLYRNQWTHKDKAIFYDGEDTSATVLTSVGAGNDKSKELTSFTSTGSSVLMVFESGAYNLKSHKGIKLTYMALDDGSNGGNFQAGNEGLLYGCVGLLVLSVLSELC